MTPAMVDDIERQIHHCSSYRLRLAGRLVMATRSRCAAICAPSLEKISNYKDLET